MVAKSIEIGIAQGKAVKEQPGWKNIYRAGAWTALLIVWVGLVDVLIMFLPVSSVTPGTQTVLYWFTRFQENTFITLRDLGLFNMITLPCSVVIFFALCGMHRRTNPRTPALALILASIGAAVYIAANVSLPMLTLSQRYTAAPESEKALWVSAGQALLAHEDLTAGAFPGFFLGEVAGILMAVALLKGGIFPRWQAWLGIIAISCLLFFNICAAFIPPLYDTVMPIFGAGGGLLSMVWYVLIARQLWRAPND